MSEAAVTSPRQVKEPLHAVRYGVALRAALGWAVLFSACSPADPGRPVLPPHFAGISGGSGAAALNGGVAGVPGPLPTAGQPPVGAGSGTTVGGAAGMGPLPPAGGSAAAGTPTAGTGGTTPPNPDGGLPEFNAGTDPARNQVRAGEICARVAAIQCAAEAHCCTAPARTVDACTTQMSMACAMSGYLDDIAKNSVSGFNPALAEAGFNTLEEYAIACDPNVVLWLARPDALRAMFQGTVAPNGMCKPGGLLPSAGNYAAALASCTQPATHSCLFTGDGPNAAPQTATCTPRGDVGAACFIDINCKDGLHCANPSMTYSGGKCAGLRQPGSECTLDTECASFTCRSAACVVATSQTAYCVSAR